MKTGLSCGVQDVHFRRATGSRPSVEKVLNPGGISSANQVRAMYPFSEGNL